MYQDVTGRVLALEVLYERLTPAEFEARIKEAPISYLPLGTLEWHGPHLPLGSDFLQSKGFFEQLAKRVGGIVLPPLFIGPDEPAQEIDGFGYYGMDWRTPDPPQQLKGSAYWVPYSLFSMLLETLLKQLHRTGFKILIAHGHGPSTNYVVANKEELSRKSGLEIFTLSQNQREKETELEFQSDHAAANETSIMMALYPELVQMENLPNDLKIWPLAVQGKDPRTDASRQHGEEIIRFNLNRMEKILKKHLSHLCESPQQVFRT